MPRSAALDLVREALRSRPAHRSRLERCHNIDDLRRAARRRLPRGPFDYLDGGAEDEATLRENVAAFGDWDLAPYQLTGAVDPDLRTTIGGDEVAMPIICAPTGFSRLFHHDGETAVASAAAAAGITYCLSTMGTRSLEQVAEAGGPRWFQLYVWRDRSLTDELVDRAKAAGYSALCLTVDLPRPGRRERDLRSGITIPPRAGLRTIVDGALRPQWWWGFLRSDPITFANVESRAGADGTEGVQLQDWLASQFDPSMTWDDAARIAERWDGPFAIKGIQRADDAVRAVDAGASIVVVSNHGGRQLDHAPASLRILPSVVDAIGDQAEVVIDGGLRRGTDVVKALALGAQAVMVGRPYLYGLAAGGEAGVARALQLLRDELHCTLQLLGCHGVADITPDLVQPRPR